MPALKFSVSILAGGLSSRMGRDKARVRLGRRTLLARVRAVAGELGVPVRVIRRDLVPRCGPLGGIYTALKTSAADAELFLACDMPFVTAAWLRRVLGKLREGRRAACAFVGGVAGFPFAMKVDCLAVVERQIAAQDFSLQSLAKVMRAARVAVPARRFVETFNINTPEELARARAKKERRKTGPGLKQRVRL
jgi:molybdopterin-guanine dinucleotide biosynthesis protein A